MTILDSFTDYGQYDGPDQERLNKQNLKKMIENYGQEWVNGYIRAMEVVAVDVANMFYTPNDGCGIEHTPHRVRSDLKKYWKHNKSFLIEMYSQVETASNGLDKPTP